MSAGREQIGRDRRIISLPGKWLKRQFSRLRRRAEKRDLENAPVRNQYRGGAA